jgi:hypothetical protein
MRRVLVSVILAGSVTAACAGRLDTDLSTLSHRRFEVLLSAYNNTPRKCLDFRTPAEVFLQLLHFECESTFPLARE